MTTRRSVLKGVVGAGLSVNLGWLGELLAAGRIAPGVHTVTGDVSVNGTVATQGMQLKAGDSVVTGPNGDVVFVVGRDAFMIRPESRVELLRRGNSPVLSGLRILSGRILSVFSRGRRRTIEAVTATIGIRGTAVYVETGPDKTYVCTCYGTVELASRGDPSARETIRTRHHDQPRYVMANGAPQMLMGAPVINHTDAELILLESLVGRSPPFGTARPYRY
jgi:hypothetical protein